jgi:leader peptidase (prepilin peptidase) / N-methyltransferase
MFIITICIVFVLGARIDRIKKNKKGIFFGRSECPKCHRKLSATDLIPIINYIYLRGKCRRCKKPIPIHYPALELFCALSLVTIFLRFPFVADSSLALSFVIYSLYTVFFTGIFFYDLLNSEIPDLMLFPLIGITLVGSLILGSPDIGSMIIALVISFIFFGGQYFLSKGTWLGEGDIYLSAAMAFAFGWELMLIAIILTYLIGGITAGILLITKKTSRKAHVPFAPFMVLGSMLTIFYGREILDWYLSYVIF